MSESAVFQTRMLPPGVLAWFLLIAGTVGMGLALAAAVVGLPLGVTVPVVLVVVVGFARRRGFDAEYQVDADGISERLTPLSGGAPREQHWDWADIRSYSLDREPTRSLAERNILLVRLPRYLLRLPEPVVDAERDAHARFVDRFVGYATGDAASAGSLRPSDTPRAEALHRRPMTTGETPQLRRTLEHRTTGNTSATELPPFLDRPMGRVTAGLGALVILGGALGAVVLRPATGAWVRLVLLLVPSGLWLAWRALRRSETA